MKRKLIRDPLVVSLLTMIALYSIGFLWNLDFLHWHFHLQTSEPFQLNINASYGPFIAGIVAGFITERILKKRYDRLTA
ncbi:hypothetical protein A374_04224 [Fictibacillus macauensis ZFHKF-1]|uniref:Uncharacterized protein n=1 Tax=Fictibacillus macauensis ZFHKF-1 TaxID=1196324 RepID=I8AM55_9BACL|nr:hypothetical protein [Fictibacillus macauensis]EIT86749.1 hypothetical protein A374_04224 [Fictibacillus macauensis ZFHKF-1]